MKLLIVEDEQTLSESIQTYLQQEGYVCESVQDYADADYKINLYQYDCIIVDITLPDGSGLDIIRELKNMDSEAGIIIISAKNAVDDKIEGLEIGADDYLAKPFSLSELNARIKALMRRRNFSGHKEITFNEIKVLPDSYQVYVNNELVELTRKEFDLLLYLLANTERVLPKDAIAEHLWEDSIDLADSFDFVYTHIKNLRRKLTAHGALDYIKTIYGIGYKFTDK